jgi:hypothetical protein
MIPVAFPLFIDDHRRSPRCRRRANRLALAFFVITALAGLALKYMPG